MTLSSRVFHTAFALVATLFCLAPAVRAADSTDTVPTEATLLVGFPLEGEPAGEGTLVVPGTVIPIRSSGGAMAAKARRVMIDEEADRSAATFEISSQLTGTFRLSRVDVAYRQPLAARIGETARLPSPTPTSAVTIEVDLLGFNRNSATYQVRFRSGSKILADSRVSAARGERTVIGGTDGPDAPYLFLVLEPRGTAAKGAQPVQVDGDAGIQAPIARTKVAPQYTEEAKEAGTTGIVIIQAVIDTAGRIEDTTVLKGLPHGLTEKALEAIRQWEFEPARDAQGNPVAVYYNLTINFTLG